MRRVIAFASGEGIFNAALGTLVSLATPPDAQGRVQGGTQALSSLAQAAGPLAGGQLYGRLGATPTFSAGAALVLAAFALLAGQQLQKEPQELAA